MLNVYFGNMPDAIYNTSAYFKFNYEREWITDPSVVKMIKDIDESEVLGNGAIYRSYFTFWRRKNLNSNR